MAVPVVGLAFSLSYLADDLHLWEKHGVRMKTVEISGIGAMNSVISGSTDFTQSSGSAITRAAARGQRLLTIVETLDRPSVQVVLRKDLAAGFDPKAPLEKRAQALRGKTIAVDAINSDHPRLCALPRQARRLQSGGNPHCGAAAAEHAGRAADAKPSTASPWRRRGCRSRCSMATR